MKKFLRDTALFLSVVIGIAAISDQLILFEHAPDPLIRIPHRVFSKSKNNQVVFVGSSITNSQVNTPQFDSITKLKSMNFGISGFFGASRDEHLLDMINRGDFNGVSCVVLEMGSMIDFRNPEALSVLASERLIYYYTYDSFVREMEVLWGDPIYTLKDKRMSTENRLALFISSREKMGYTLFRYAYQGIVGEANYISQAYSGRLMKQQGFVPFEDMHRSYYNELAWQDQIDLSIKYVNQLNKQQERANSSFVEKYIELDEALKSRGIDLLIMIPQLAQNNHLYDVHCLSDIERVFDGRIINFSLHHKFPELYKVEYSFDTYHLNRKGSRVYTALLAEYFTSEYLIEHPINKNDID